VVKFDKLPLLRGPHLTGDNLLISPPALVMKMTQESDPSIPPESPGGGYKAVMVAMYGEAFHTFFPLVLVRDHCPFHSNVSQTLVRPDRQYPRCGSGD